MDLYIKVEVELDEAEKPDKVAAEICRVIQKLYVVRSAELSSAVATGIVTPAGDQEARAVPWQPAACVSLRRSSRARRDTIP